MQKIEEILKLAEEIAAPLGFTIVDVRLSQEGKRRSLEVTICKRGGRLSLTDCEDLSRKLDKELDEHTPPLIDGAYVLNVQSPGLDRQLKTDREYEVFVGEQVEVQTKEKIPSLGAVFEGKLVSKKDGVLTLNTPKPIVQASKSKKKAKDTSTEEALPENIQIEVSKVALVRLHPGEPEQTKATAL